MRALGLAVWFFGTLTSGLAFSDPGAEWQGPEYTPIGIVKSQLMVATNESPIRYCLYDFSKPKAREVGKCSDSKKIFKEFEETAGFTRLKPVEAGIEFGPGLFMKLPTGKKLLFEKKGQTYTVSVENKGKRIIVTSDLNHAAEHSGECSAQLFSGPDAFFLLVTNYGTLEVVRIDHSIN